ncbi:MAG: PaaI family thioesterase, partial [candidate division WOR-3 bacterium]|nr:PaaI family thioesterase [candidate division WOR-3 bacterium]
MSNIIGLPEYKGCFACGRDNPAGLRLNFKYDRDLQEVFAYFNLDERYIGFNDVLHGGILSTVADDAMAWSAMIRTNNLCLTKNLEIEFLMPGKPRTDYTVRARSKPLDERTVQSQASIVSNRGKIIVKAQSRFMQLRGRRSRIFKKQYNL